MAVIQLTCISEVKSNKEKCSSTVIQLWGYSHQEVGPKHPSLKWQREGSRVNRHKQDKKLTTHKIRLKSLEKRQDKQDSGAENRRQDRQQRNIQDKEDYGTYPRINRKERCRNMHSNRRIDSPQKEERILTFGSCTDIEHYHFKKKIIKK